MLETFVQRLTGGRLLELLREIRDIHAMQRLAPLATDYVPWTASALRPAALVTVLNDIVVNQRSRIVECGGGVSSLYIAELLERSGEGALLVLEHDASWARRLRTLLGERGVGDRIRVVHAPLQVDEQLSPDGTAWYSADVVRRALGDRRVDLLLVDGPPAYEEATRLARYPALPFFWDRLGEHCTIVLDDVDRDGEQEVVRRWERELDVTFEMRTPGEDIARGVIGGSYTV